jgi:hypothetical protein
MDLISRDLKVRFKRIRKLQKATISTVMYVRLYGTTMLPLQIFWLNFVFEFFPKICCEN